MSECKHIMVSGKNKGKPCGKRCTQYLGYDISYCWTHEKLYSEYKQKIEKLAAEKSRMRNQKRQEFEQKIEARKYNYQNLWRLSRDRESKEIKDLLYVPSVKIEDIITAVDKICEQALMAYRMIEPGGSFHEFYLYPCHLRGFTTDEIAPEFEKRGYETYTLSDGRFRVHMKYLPEF